MHYLTRPVFYNVTPVCTKTLFKPVRRFMSYRLKTVFLFLVMVALAMNPTCLIIEVTLNVRKML